MQKSFFYGLRIMCMCVFLCQSMLASNVSNKFLSFGERDKGGFSLSDFSIVCDTADYAVVRRSAEMLASDIEKVTGFKPTVGTGMPEGKVLLLGTLGHHALIDRLVSDGKIDVAAIEGGWEQFVVRRVENPFSGVAQALVIAGSDRRGTAYGAMTISEQMGVSPWTWWADVPVKEHAKVTVMSDFTSKRPSVQYRGIFINDEDWGLKPWSSKNYEKELGDIGPATYERVCELILRLKGNMLAPAMHTCTGAFYCYPKSKEVADKYAIIITTSHCEPLLFNNASPTEWNKQRDGEWDYNKNKEVIYKKMDDRVREAASYENIYTIAMRGVHDEGLRGGLSDKERVETLTRVIKDQREILENNLKKPADQVPQIFVPYKETLDIYEDGLKVPDDVTIVWPDDNYGYMKRLSNIEEQRRKGGAGVYYHLSYLGAPHDYLWLCTTPPVLMYEELKKAYDTGSDRYWLLNVGDIKPMELGIQTFMEMAWDMSRFDYEKVNEHQSAFMANIYGAGYADELQDILDGYYRLAWSRKPEFMGWEREWDAPRYKDLADTEFSFDNYNDARQRIADYKRLSDHCERILSELPEQYRASFFEMLGYPVMASYQMNRKFLLAQYNHEQSQAGNHATANWAAKEAKAAFDSINVLTERYNSLLDGKWRYMMDIPKGWVAKYQEMPRVFYKEGAGEASADLSPVKKEYKLDRCMVVDLAEYESNAPDDERCPRLIEGLGYDWQVLQLGEATQQPADPTDVAGVTATFELPKMDVDTVRIHISTLPFFPLYEGRGTRFGVSVDGCEPYVLENNPVEFTQRWKDDVLRNGTVYVLDIPVNQKLKRHTLTLICGDPGVMVQKIVADWGGLKDTYVGPALKR